MQDEKLRTIEKCIISIIEKEHPETVDKITQMIQNTFEISKDETVRVILSLQDRGLIKLKDNSTRIPQTLSSYLSSVRSLWYWTTLALSIATSGIVLLVPEGTYPLVYIRYVLGLIFVLWLPGYSFIKAIPKRSTDSDKEKGA